MALERQIDLDGHTLSGGEIQRLAITRIKVKRYCINMGFLDEPTTALDKQNSLKVMDLIVATCRNINCCYTRFNFIVTVLRPSL